MCAADGNNNVVGGHLNKATVSATCEMFIHVIDGEVNRKFSDEIGLNLFEFQIIFNIKYHILDFNEI